MKKTLDALIWRAIVAVVPRLGAAYIGLVLRTVRWDWIARAHFDAVRAADKPFIVAFWHGRLAMMVPVIGMSDLPAHVIISNNKDGELIARLVGLFGGLTIRGSTRDPRKRKGKGGETVLRAAVGRLRAGELVAITPDGPRGPSMRAQAGVAAMSAMTGVPVIPFAWATRRARRLGSWDGFLLPWPFDRGFYAVGAPIGPTGRDREAVEAHRLAIEKGLDAVTRLADERAGRAPAAPAGSA